MRVYSPKSTVQELAANGVGALTVEYATVHEEINGEFSLTFKVAETSAHLDAVVIGGIVKADTPRGPQFFRMSKPVTTLDGGKEVFAWHISYDLAQDLILNRAWTGKTGAEALPDILQAGISETRFTGTSDIPLITNMRIVRTSVLGAIIGDQDNSFIKRWGGEIERDNFMFNVKNRIGADKGMTVRYRKNLIGLTLEEDDSEVTNRVIPTGLTKDDTVIMLPEVYIDSPRINDTPIPHVRHVHFGDVKVGKKDADDNIPYPNANAVIAELRARVAQMYEQGVDLPLKSATVEFVDLSQTEEYKDYAHLETVMLGDTVACIYKDIKLSQRVVSYEYDVLAKKYISIVLGSVLPTLGDSLWAQDLDLSALKNEVAGAVMQGVPYNNVYINHEDGYVAQAMIDGVDIEVRQNAHEGFSVYANNEYIGGVRIMNGKAAFVGNVITNDVDGNCWAEIGDVSVPGGMWRGLLIYNKQYSETVPLARVLTFNNGHVAVRRPSGSSGIEFWPDGTVTISGAEGTQRLFISADDDFGIQNNNGDYQSFLSDTNSYIKPSTGANHAVGADTSGPYYVKNNVKTYF